ncbi:MAG: IS1595 family transposase [Phycisphaerales bacterium]|nr:IS1595 family transposase [Phycisphaerales bacterium]
MQQQISKEASVMTDGYKAYSKLSSIVKRHKVVIVKDKTKVDKVFPWVHKAISNAKRLLLGIHHSVKGSYLQNYLDEYCYKFNRRYFGEKQFDRLLVAAVSSTWYHNRYN